MLDTVISGGLAVLPNGAATADIGVQGEKIVALGAPGSLAALNPGRTIDASGQVVIPGGIDPHVPVLPIAASGARSPAAPTCRPRPGQSRSSLWCRRTAPPG